MPSPSVSLIHPTAVISPAAQLAPDVQIGAFAIIDGPVELGAGCIIHGHAQILGRVVAGPRNTFGPGCIIGGPPQHLGYQGEPTAVRIGEGNSFREHVTVHRGMPTGTGETVIGNHNLFMVGAHVAHDCVVGDHCFFVNGSLLGGHAHIGDRVLISGNSAVHQHCRVGRLALISGVSASSQDVPPFWIIRDINLACGVNVIGMRRAGIPTAEIMAVRQAFKLIYLSKLPLDAALAAMTEQYGEHPAVQELVAFIRTSKRGVPGANSYHGDTVAA